MKDIGSSMGLGTDCFETPGHDVEGSRSHGNCSQSARDPGDSSAQSERDIGDRVETNNCRSRRKIAQRWHVPGHPLGIATATVTDEAGRVASVNTEAHPVNARGARGLLGLLLHLRVAIRGLVGAHRFAAWRQGDLGALVASFRWLNGDLHSAAWFLPHGWVDRSTSLSAPDSSASRRGSMGCLRPVP